MQMQLKLVVKKSDIIRYSVNVAWWQYLDPPDADGRLGHFLDSSREEQSNGEADGAVQRHSHKHTAGRDFVAHQNIHSERHKQDDFIRRKERGHVQSSEVRAAHDFWDLLSTRNKQKRDFSC